MLSAALRFCFLTGRFVRAAGFIVISMSLPYMFGQTAAGSSGTSVGEISTPAKGTEFAVATIKPNIFRDGRWKVGFTSNGYFAAGVSVHRLIQEAYGVFENNRISGEPQWLGSEKYDLEAKVDDSEYSVFHNLDLDGRRVMIQKLLAKRFKLVVRHESKELPIYALTVAKGGSRFHETTPDHVPTRTFKGFGGTVLQNGHGRLVVEWETMAYFARQLTWQVDRIVVDKTGLTGHTAVQDSGKSLGGALI